MTTKAQVPALVTNPSNSPITLAYGRRLLDDKGLVWRVAATLVVAANGTGTLLLDQNELRNTSITDASRSKSVVPHFLSNLLLHRVRCDV